MATIEETIAHANKMAEHYEKEAEGLIAQHGTGVRPSWVSTDLAIANQRAKSYRDLAASLVEEDDDSTTS